MKQSKLLNNVLRKMQLLLIAPAALLTGCGATLPQCPTGSAVLPVMPSISTPLPPVSYSISASEDIARWRRMLKDTQLLSNY